MPRCQPCKPYFNSGLLAKFRGAWARTGHTLQEGPAHRASRETFRPLDNGAPEPARHCWTCAGIEVERGTGAPRSHHSRQRRASALAQCKRCTGGSDVEMGAPWRPGDAAWKAKRQARQPNRGGRRRERPRRAALDLSRVCRASAHPPGSSAHPARQELPRGADRGLAHHALQRVSSGRALESIWFFGAHNETLS